MRGRLAMLILAGLATSASASAERVNLNPGARVCDATDCYALSPKGLSVVVWQRIPGGGIQFQWKGELLTADAHSIDDTVQTCDWGSYRDQRTYLCDGFPARPLSEDEARPARHGRPTPEVAAWLRASGQYASYYGADAAQ